MATKIIAMLYAQAAKEPNPVAREALRAAAERIAKGEF
jgi:hypothetical protein